MNLVYNTLMRRLPGVKKRGGGNWSNFNAVCCTHNGEVRPDTRGRGGLILGSDDTCVYSCFNCKYKAAWSTGQRLSRRMENLLEWTNIPADELKKLKFKIWQLQQNALSDNPFDTSKFQRKTLSFKDSGLPPGSQTFSYWLKPENFREDFLDVAAYAMDRGPVFDPDQMYWCPDKTEAHYDINKRMILPFYWEEKLVGFTARDTTGTAKYRYYTEAQANYLYNTSVIDHNSKYIFVCEGPFDALAMNGIATLGDKVSQEQIDWLNDTGKKIVVVPDREKAGGKLVDVAMRQGWGVSFPKWGDNMEVKDAAQAAKELGKIYTMLSVSHAIVDSAQMIGVYRQRLKATKR